MILILEQRPHDPNYRWSHRVKREDLKRGDHIYAWRKGCLYQHHGIVIEKSDIPDQNYRNLPIPIIEDLMVIENNRTEPNIRIVTLSQFAANYYIRRVQYGMTRKRDMFVLDIKFRGKCYMEDQLTPDEIIKNARFLYNASGMCTYDFKVKAMVFCKFCIFIICRSSRWQNM